MDKKKRNTIITIIIVALILIVGGVIFFLNYSHSDSSLTILEKKWITDKTNKVVDINIYNDIPVYSYNGSGMIFDYITYFTDKTMFATSSTLYSKVILSPTSYRMIVR